MKFSKFILPTAMMLMATNAHSLIIQNVEDIDIYGSEAFVSVYDSGKLTTYKDTDIAFLYGYDNSTFDITGGDISWLHLYDNNVTNISFVSDLSWLLVNDNATVNIYADNLSYSNGHLSGTWGNGSDFSFWALEQADLTAGSIGDVIPDNITLHATSVSEPSILAMFAIGAAGFLFRRKTK